MFPSPRSSNGCSRGCSSVSVIIIVVDSSSNGCSSNDVISCINVAVIIIGDGSTSNGWVEIAIVSHLRLTCSRKVLVLLLFSILLLNIFLFSKFAFPLMLIALLVLLVPLQSSLELLFSLAVPFRSCFASYHRIWLSTILFCRCLVPYNQLSRTLFTLIPLFLLLVLLKPCLELLFSFVVSLWICFASPHGAEGEIDAMKTDNVWLVNRFDEMENCLCYLQ